MTTTSTAILQLSTTGDIVIGPESYAATINTASPGQSAVVALTTGDNTISVPTGATRISITGKPSGNTVALALGTGGAVPLGLVDWDSLSLPSGATTIVINAASAVSVRVTFT